VQKMRQQIYRLTPVIKAWYKNTPSSIYNSLNYII